jgi:hypothetical protein
MRRSVTPGELIIAILFAFILAGCLIVFVFAIVVFSLAVIGAIPW